MCTQRAALTHRWPRRSRRCSRRFRKLACCTARRQARRRLTRRTRVPFLPHGPQRVGARSVSASYNVLQLTGATCCNTVQHAAAQAHPRPPRVTSAPTRNLRNGSFDRQRLPTERCHQSHGRRVGAEASRIYESPRPLGSWSPPRFRPASARPPHSAPHASIPNRTTHSTR